MLKTAYKNNSLSFLCYFGAIALIVFGFVLSIFPDVENYGWGYNYGVNYVISALDLALFVACFFSIMGLALSSEFINKAKMLSYILIIAIVGRSAFFKLFCELAEGSDFYLSNKYILYFIGELFIFISCVILLFARIRNLQPIFNLVILAGVGLGFLLQLIYHIGIMVDYNIEMTFSQIFSLLITFALPLFFAGDFFETAKQR